MEIGETVDCHATGKAYYNAEMVEIQNMPTKDQTYKAHERRTASRSKDPNNAFLPYYFYILFFIVILLAQHIDLQGCSEILTSKGAEK